MYYTKLTIILLCHGCTESIVLKQSNCLEMIATHILKDYEFETKGEAYFEVQSLINSLVTFSDYISHSKIAHIAVLKETPNADYKLVFNNFRYDEKYVIVVNNSNFLNQTQLLAEWWFKKRAKIGILQVDNNNITFVTTLNLEVTKVCTNHFYEKITCDSNLSITRHYLSKDNFEKLCKIRVSWVRAYPFVDNVWKGINPGLMVSFINTYGDTKQTKIQFLEDNSKYNNELLYNGTLHQLHKDLQEGKYDVAIGPLYMNATEDIPFTYGPVIFNDVYCITTRKRERIASYKKLAIIFSLDVWKSFLITFFLVILSYFLLGLAIESHKLSFVGTILNVYRMSLSSGITILPRSSSLRLLLVFYLLFSINMDSAYLGTLSSILTNSPYDIIQTDLSIIMQQGVAVKTNWFAERLLKLGFVARRSYHNFLKQGSTIGNESDEDSFKRIAYTQENITFTLMSTIISHPYEASLVDYFLAYNVDLSLFATFYIRSDFHLRDSLLYWSQEIVEKGFVTKWMKDLIDQNRNGSHIVREKKEAIPLKFQHFEDIFKVLSFGYALAALALLLEFAYKWIDHHLNLTRNIVYILSLLKPPPVYD